MTDSRWTVPQELKRLGFDPTNRDSWQIGWAVRDRWVELTGDLPPKELRTKTNGAGSHCFALYPEWWREGRKLVRDMAGILAIERDRQGDLFKP